MFKLNFKIPKNIAIAVSGGIDSMAALDFLSFKRNITALHYNHGTQFSDSAQEIVENYCRQKNINLIIGKLKEQCPKGRSLEDFWREQRYAFFEKEAMLPRDLPIITCHHLDDVAETWLFTSMHGRARLIPSKRGNYLRPFLSTRKSEFEKWVSTRGIPYIEDPSNQNISFMRNYIRNVMMPHALHVNPGLHKVLKKNILSTNLLS